MRGPRRSARGRGRILRHDLRHLTREPHRIPQVKSELAARAAEDDTHPFEKALIAQLLHLLDGVRDESSNQSPETLTDEARNALIQEAMRIAEPF